MSLKDIEKSAKEAIAKAEDLKVLEALRVKYLGRKAELNFFLRSLASKALEERREFGPLANKLKKDIGIWLDEKIKEFKSEKPKRPLDVSRPGARVSRGHLHPLTQVNEEVRRIFSSMNFSIVDGPEAETEYYNFDALNIPADHPARDMWDTFWLKDSPFLLRTHTSPMQVRYMEAHNPPFQIIVPGRVFRYEATDASHEFNFYQVEGLMVGPKISLANFKFVVEGFFKRFFRDQKIEFRFRPSYFPFVEPGVEVDIKLKGGKWLEMMGAGMVHRSVFDSVRYNPDEVQGFAFGMGLDRLAMVKYNIPDIRLFYSGDLRFIKQF